MKTDTLESISISYRKQGWRFCGSMRTMLDWVPSQFWIWREVRGMVISGEWWEVGERGDVGGREF